MNIPLKIKMNKELRKTNNKERTISIKNDILNNFLNGIVEKRLIRMFSSFLQDRTLKYLTPAFGRIKFDSIDMDT